MNNVSIAQDPDGMGKVAPGINQALGFIYTLF